jgi:uncharacterized membrane protein YedE/YeeE
MTEFTPLSALAGGALIGAAAVVLWLAIGRVAGVSGILAGAIAPAGADGRDWRLAFVLGLPLGAWGVGWWQGGLPVDVSVGPVGLIVAGLLVGFGTQLGGGCTSGHGVCGISRGSGRSIVATAVFMASGGATVFIVRHLLGNSG